MEEKDAPDTRQRMIKWIEEGRNVLVLLPGLLEETERLEARAKVVERECERLRLENSELQGEQEELLEGFGKLLAETLHPMNEMLQKVRGTQRCTSLDPESPPGLQDASLPLDGPSLGTDQPHSPVGTLENGQVAPQPVTVARIGFLSSRGGPSEIVEAFSQCLHELGHVNGQTIATEYRWAAGRTDRLPDLATELVGFGVNVLVADGMPAARAAKATTQTIPIIVAVGGHPVSAGIVPSLARPGGNITGTALIFSEVGAKRLGLLKEAIPGLSRVAVLWNPAQPGQEALVKELEHAAPSVPVQLHPLAVRAPRDFEGAFSQVTKWRPGALLAFDDLLFIEHRRRIADLAMTHRLPTMFGFRLFVDAGGLMAYGPSLADMFRRAATYVDKILKGAKPADLPIEQCTKFELVINLKTAKALGLTIPQSVLILADEVIE